MTIHRRCSQELATPCCDCITASPAWMHPSHMHQIRSSCFPKYFIHLISTTKVPTSTVHLKPVLRQPPQKKINALNRWSGCCYWRAGYLSKHFPHKSSMRSSCERGGCSEAYLFAVCSSAMVLWRELHGQEQRALGCNEMWGKMADVCHEWQSAKCLKTPLPPTPHSVSTL